jgi:dipeptidyl aminopeptidase/acylaminoacyl peptidase
MAARRRPPASARRLVLSQVAPGDVVLSPDGSLACACRRSVERGAYVTTLWLVPLDGGAPRQLTRGPVDDAAPAFDPLGGRVAFLRERQVHAIPLDGGEAERLTAAPHGVDAFAWAPDGRRLALLLPDAAPRLAVGPLRDGEAPLARRIVRADWRLDGAGLLDRHSHLWVAPARAGARPRRLTGGDFSVRSFAWAPDATRLCFAADVRPDADLLDAPALHLVAAAGGEPEPLCALPGSCEAPCWSPDGSALGFVGVAAPNQPEDAARSLYVVPAAGGEPRDLLPGRHLLLGPTFGSDLGDWRHESGRQALFEGSDALLLPVTERGLTALWRVPLAGEPQPLTEPGLAVERFAHAGGRTVVLAYEDHLAPALFALRRERPPRRLTRRPRLERALAGLRSERLDVPGPAGPIRTWVLHPEGVAGPAPTVLSIHGGPTGSWGPAPWLTDLALAARGCRVLRPDPRGSASYGRDWQRAIMNDWGGGDAEDCLSVCDFALAQGLADPERLAVTGLSYGGYLTQWLVSQTDRFRAAVAANGVANLVAAAGNCDLGVPWNERLGFGPLPQGAADMWRQSPLAHCDRIRTPLLMLQGAADLRCPPSDNEQLFLALRALRREVEYVLYPDESHVMQATGRPDRRVDMLERTLAWLERHGVAPPR